MKHLVRDSVCLTPYTADKSDPSRHYVRVVKTEERVWVATTWCGKGHHGVGDFPHGTLRHHMDDTDVDWCPGCIEDKRGVAASDRDFARPNLYKEFSLWESQQ